MDYINGICYLSLGELTDVDYNFKQVTSLEKTFGNFGFCGNNYMKQDMIGNSSTSISVIKLMSHIATMIGVSESDIKAIRAPQARSDSVAVGYVDGAARVTWKGDSVSFVVSYLNIDYEEEFTVQINGSFNLIEQAEGELSQFEYIDGSRNLVELLSGSNR